MLPDLFSFVNVYSNIEDNDRMIIFILHSLKDLEIFSMLQKLFFFLKRGRGYIRTVLYSCVLLPKFFRVG